MNPPPELGVCSMLARHATVAELHLEFAHLLKSYAPRTSLACPPVESNTLELLNTLRCYGTWLSCLIQLVVAALLINPLPKLRVGSVLLWHATVAELDPEFAQLLKSYAQRTSLACPPVESNTLELLNTLRCYGTWLSFLIQLVVAALLINPLPKLQVGSVLLWHATVAELYLEFAQLLKSYAPRISLACPPVESNTLELLNTLRCNRTSWLSFLIQLVVAALSVNPAPELGVCSILSWHATVAELHLEFAHLFKPFVPQ